MERAIRLTQHIHVQDAEGKGIQITDDDVVIVSAVRTAIGKGKKGNFRDTYPTQLLAAVLKGVVDRVGLDSKLIQDVQVGNCLQPGAGAGGSRQALFLAGYSHTTSLAAVNRQCSSGLQACSNIFAAIKAGVIDIGVGAGVESMSFGSGPAAAETTKAFFDKEVLKNSDAKDCLIPMGITSENVASQFKITREKQDEFALASYNKAVAAAKAGLFKSEIVPVRTTVKTADGKLVEVVVSEDEGPRPTTYEDLAKLKPSFSKDGSSTAGNSSQVSDGAAAVLMMRRSKARELGLKPLARFLSYAVAGVPPSIMGIGPAVAIPEALKKANLTVNDIDVFEINEAFASQAVYCVEALKIDPSKVNPVGGAIALGHPLGCTGARQIATIIPELQRSNKRYGVMSMCIGTGMGAAAVIERE